MPAKQFELFSLENLKELDLPQGPELSPSSPLEDTCAPFQKYMEQKEFTENTIRCFLSDMRLFVEFAGPTTPLSECSTKKLRDFLHYLQEERDTPCAPKTLDRRITTLKVFFEWLVRYDILPHDPAEPLEHRQAHSPLPHILSESQIETLLSITRAMRDADEAPDARPHLLVTLILSTGMKKGECMDIALEHIDPGAPDTPPSVYIHYDEPRLLFKRRRLALPEDWIDTLEIYLRRYQPQEKLFECTARNLEYVLHKISDLANLRSNITFEMLRWTCAVRNYQEGMDEERLRKRLGLSEIAWPDTLSTIQKLGQGPL
ncbi:MAG: tyrosine-type recombinase/integrase [Anaerolineales bacterium]